jgi:DNA-binding winged helix-turn-helix (wHTH) protein
MNYNTPCIDCQKPCRGERCRRCKSIHDAGPLPHCAGCGNEIGRKLMYCEGCRPASRRRKKYGRTKPENITTCIGCGCLVKKYREGKQRCRTCANKDPARLAKCSVSMKAKLQEPEYAAKHERTIQNALAALHTPQVKARAEIARKIGGGYERRDKRRFAWCPEEYRDLYRRWMKRYKKNPEGGHSLRYMTAAEGRARIERMFGGPLRPLTLTTEDVALHQCRVDGNVVGLGPQQLSIVLHLIGTRPDRYVSTEELIRAVWPNANTEPESADNTLKAQILHLRRKGVCIVNVSGIGYRIAPQVRGSQVAPSSPGRAAVARSSGERAAVASCARRAA